MQTAEVFKIIHGEVFTRAGNESSDTGKDFTFTEKALSNL